MRTGRGCSDVRRVELVQERVLWPIRWGNNERSDYTAQNRPTFRDMHTGDNDKQRRDLSRHRFFRVSKSDPSLTGIFPRSRAAFIALLYRRCSNLSWFRKEVQLHVDLNVHLIVPCNNIWTNWRILIKLGMNIVILEANLHFYVLIS